MSSAAAPHTDQIIPPTGGDHDAGKINFDFGKEMGTLALISGPSIAALASVAQHFGPPSDMLPYAGAPDNTKV